MGHDISHGKSIMNLIGSWDQQRIDEFKQQDFSGLTPGRVISASRGRYQVRIDGQNYPGFLTGKFRHLVKENKTLCPVVGDWLALDLHTESAMIHRLLTRRNWFSRQYSGTTIGEQIVCSNIDYLLITMALDQDFNLKRLDRYFTMAHRGGVQPLVVLTKADVCADASMYVARVRYERDEELPVVAVSTKVSEGIFALKSYLTEGVTACFVGSSGAGKSTLINHLSGSDVAITGVLSDGNGRGKCTTSMVRAYPTLLGSLLIDAPGMREIQLWAEEEDLEDAFNDIAYLAAHCKFRDCKHQGEPGCIVREALLNGELTQVRFLSYMKLRSEIVETRECMRAKKKQRFKEIRISQRKRRRMEYGS